MSHASHRSAQGIERPHETLSAARRRASWALARARHTSEPSPKLQPMSKARAEAFSDGVIAVAITLLALNLHVPDPNTSAGTLAHNLSQQWPQYAAYVVSFVTIGIIWINHHATLRRIVAVDQTILMLNLTLLMTIVLLPFTTALMAEYLKASHGEKLAAAIYGGSLLLMSIAFFNLHLHLLRAKSYLLDAHMTPELRRSVLLRNFAGLPPYAIATAPALISPYVTLAICGAIAAFYAAPRTNADVYEEPREGT
jgi:uncharacterized membrane protein